MDSLGVRFLPNMVGNGVRVWGSKGYIPTRYCGEYPSPRGLIFLKVEVTKDTHRARLSKQNVSINSNIKINMAQSVHYTLYLITGN